MKPLSDYSNEILSFNQPSMFKRIHELRANGELIGTLQNKGFFGMHWDVSIQNQNWEIYRPCLWKSAIDIRPAGYEMSVANYTRKGFKSRGTVILPKGEKLKINPRLFKGFTEITTEQDECLVRIKTKMALRDKAEVTIGKKSELINKYPWVIILAYIITLEQRHHAAHASV